MLELNLTGLGFEVGKNPSMPVEYSERTLDVNERIHPKVDPVMVFLT